MKSKTSFLKQLTAAWTGQIWVFALMCLTFFTTGPMHGLMMIDQWKDWATPAPEFAELFLKALQCRQDEAFLSLYIIGLIAVAVISGWSAFIYLHNSRKTDFYHALPVRRDRLFGMQVLTAAVNYLISAAGAILLLILIASVRHIMTAAALRLLLGIYAAGLICFMLCFAVTALAMMLTGRFLVGVLGTMVFFGLGSLLPFLFTGYKQVFFSTYAEEGRYMSRAALLGMSNFSPAGFTFRTMTELSAGGLKYCAAGAAAAAVLLLLVLVVYRLRPSEAASRAMAFSAFGSAAQIVLTTVGALTIGLFFYAFMTRRRDFWLLFGVLFGLAVIYTVIQMIYQMDIRSILGGKKELLAALVLTLMTVAFFRYDLAGYDRYLPRQDKIDSAAVEIIDYGYEFTYGHQDTDRLKRRLLPCDDTIYGILKQLVDVQQQYEPAVADGFYDSYEQQWISTQVLVRMKNGRTYRRNYYVPAAEVRDQLSSLYDYEAYVDECYLINKVTPDCLKAFEVVYTYASETRPVIVPDETQLLKMAEALQADTREITSQTVREESPVFYLHYALDVKGLGMEVNPWNNGAGWYYEGLGNYEELTNSRNIINMTAGILPSFTRTLQLLEEMGYEPEEMVPVNRITAVMVGVDEPVRYTDEETIRELAGQIVYHSYVTPLRSWGEPVTVEWTDEDGNKNYAEGRLPLEENEEITIRPDGGERLTEAVSEFVTE